MTSIARRIREQLGMVYVIDCAEATGYECHVPRFIARRIVNRSMRCLDIVTELSNADWE